MDFNKKSIDELDVSGKKILLRCDFNVPLDKQTGAITDDGRIRATLPTVTYLLDHGAAVIACSHLGRPKGEWKEELSLKPVAARLSALIDRPVKMAKDVIGPDAKAQAAKLKGGEILLLENLRFHKQEEKNDPDFARELASMAEVFVNDAFGTAHRAHASTAGVAVGADTSVWETSTGRSGTLPNGSAHPSSRPSSSGSSKRFFIERLLSPHCTILRPICPYPFR